MTLTALQQDIAVAWWGAGSFSGADGLSSEQQTQVNEFLDDGYDRIAIECFGGSAWLLVKDETGITYVLDQSDYPGKADMRRIVAVTEVIGGKTRTLTYMPWENFELSWGSNAQSVHPALAPEGVDPENKPRFYTWRGFDDTDPPLPIIRIYPAPGSTEVGGLMHPLYRGYMSKLSADQYVYLMPGARRALKPFVKMLLAADKGNKDQFLTQRMLYKDEVKFQQLHEDAPDEAPRVQVEPGDFISEIQRP